MRQTVIQRLFARNGPLKIALAAGVAGMMAWTARTLLSAYRPTFLGTVWFVFMMIVAGVLGFLVAVVAAAILLPPLYRLRGVKNGAPYAVGDEVLILAGPHRGQVARVYQVWSEWQGVRVELGDQERDQVTDVFSYVEVCRRPVVE
jgi:hypothetical protein